MAEYVTIVVRSVRLLSACVKTFTPLVNCIVSDGLVSAMPKYAENAASVHNTCLDKIVCYLRTTFIRNQKLKQQVSNLSTLKLGMCLQINAFSFAFSSRYAKTRTSNFRKVVRQHTEGTVGSII